jgi:hypothetical protein
MTATEISTTNTTETQFDPAKAEAFGGQMNAGCAAVRALPRSGPAVLEYVIGQRPHG